MLGPSSLCFERVQIAEIVCCCWLSKPTLPTFVFRAKTMAGTMVFGGRESYETGNTYLHHQQQRVKYNQHHYKILERGGYHDPPDFVFEAVPLVRHVPL